MGSLEYLTHTCRHSGSWASSCFFRKFQVLVVKFSRNLVLLDTKFRRNLVRFGGWVRPIFGKIGYFLYEFSAKIGSSGKVGNV